VIIWTIKRDDDEEWGMRVGAGGGRHILWGKTRAFNIVKAGYEAKEG